MVININFNKYNNIVSFLQSLPPLSLDSYDQEVIFDVEYTCGRFVDSDCYLLLTCIYNELKALGKDVKILFDTDTPCDNLNYASRIDFFKHVDIEYVEKFTRNNVNGRMIEITHLPPDSYGMNSIVDMFANNFGLNEEQAEGLIFVFNELICNTTIHSQSNNGGYIYAQKYPNRKILNLTIADCGIGIQASLNKKYNSLSNQNALTECLKYEVTCGIGHGHGLFMISELLKSNQGALHIYSFENNIKVNSFDQSVGDNALWNGTIVKCNFNLSQPLGVYDLFKQLNYS